MRKAIATRDYDGREPMGFGRLDFWLPSRNNEERMELELPTAWLVSQVCPEHPVERYMMQGSGEVRGFKAFRARWARIERRWRPAVHFLCPRGHTWECVLPEVI